MMIPLKCRPFIGFAAAAIFILACASQVLASGMQDTVNISLLKGSPKIMKSGSNVWAPCVVNMKIANGDRIMTGKGEEAEIAFSGDRANMVKVEEDSDMAVVIKDGVGRSIDLFSGAVMARIKKIPHKSTFQVRTPTGISGVRGTGWRSATDGRSSTFAAYENSIYTRGIDASGNEMPGEVIVGSGFMTTVDRYSNPSDPERLPPGDIERWNSWNNSLASSGGQDAGGGRDFSKADNLESQIESREARMDAVSEARDTERIQERLDANSEKNDSPQQEQEQKPHEVTHE